MADELGVLMLATMETPQRKFQEKPTNLEIGRQIREIMT